MKVKRESEVAQSCLTLATAWTAAYQAPPSMGFSRQKYWSGVQLPSPGKDFLNRQQDSQTIEKKKEKERKKEEEKEERKEKRKK